MYIAREMESVFLLHGGTPPPNLTASGIHIRLWFSLTLGRRSTAASRDTTNPTLWQVDCGRVAVVKNPGRSLSKSWLNQKLPEKSFAVPVLNRDLLRVDQNKCVGHCGMLSIFKGTSPDGAICIQVDVCEALHAAR